MISKSDARTIVCGLFPDGQKIEDLSPIAREEIRRAVDVLLRITKREEKE